MCVHVEKCVHVCICMCVLCVYMCVCMCRCVYVFVRRWGRLGSTNGGLASQPGVFGHHWIKRYCEKNFTAGDLVAAQAFVREYECCSDLRSKRNGPSSLGC